MSTLTEHLIEQYHSQGYVILTDALHDDQLSALREEADLLVNHLLSEGYDLVDDLGCIVEPLTCGYLDKPDSEQYRIDVKLYKERRDSILLGHQLSDLTLTFVARLAKELLKDDVYLLNEQYIIKPPHTASKSQFAWHRDSDYLSPTLQKQHTVACWIALDPVTLENGTLLVESLKNGETTVVEVAAGSIVFMSNRVRHKSTGNKSALFRRAFMPQYSTQPMQDSATEYIGIALPCLATKQKNN
ncbi:hypothetical protein EC973_002503 [Apophysomyces ossiformis]|uniref:Phytanoyl-CoA dioxygenase family protein n=1 Tax=Apophysomyces ossiformis TaxID=679940 RepID=A0A8H7BW68_9FUNG|nr:hypothetical protein EC973_002503 [Apophysomyces ossiformis]